MSFPITGTPYDTNDPNAKFVVGRLDRVYGFQVHYRRHIMDRFPLPYRLENAFRITTLDRDITISGIKWFGRKTYFPIPDYLRNALHTPERANSAFAFEEAEILQVLADPQGIVQADLYVWIEQSFGDNSTTPTLLELPYSVSGFLDEPQVAGGSQSVEITPPHLDAFRTNSLLWSDESQKERHPNDRGLEVTSLIERVIRQFQWPPKQ